MRSTSLGALIVLGAIPVLLAADEGGCEIRTPIGEDVEVCGDGVISGDEQCDLTDVAGEDCTDQGFTGGTLACGGDCLFDTSGCTSDACTPGETADCACSDGTAGTRTCTEGDWSDCECLSMCGNGVLDESEDCDLLDLDGQDCAGLGFTSGSLVCNDDCRFDTSGCIGDPECVSGETTSCTCSDGSTGARTCVDGHWGDCGGCEGSCGDGALDVGEDCDLTNLAGQDCADFGFTGGSLACDGVCRFETSGCTGDPECISGETMACACADGSTGARTCVDGHWGDCGGCGATCGDGAIDTGEDCDLTNLAGQDCADFGFTGGSLDCDGLCRFDTSGCTGGTSMCGDGTCAADETVGSCPVDCMAGLPTEGRECADVDGDRLCAAGHTCITIGGLPGGDSHFCYLAGCTDASDCSDSLIESSPIANVDFFTGLKTQCVDLPVGGDGACIGYSPPFFAEEGSLSTESVLDGPDYLCRECDPLSLFLPDEYFDADPWSPWPFDETELRCRRHCAVDADCESGNCLLIGELSTDDYACVLVPTGYCCLPGDDAPGCL